MASLEDLLRPVSHEDPCGPDPSTEIAFVNMESYLREEKWNDLHRACRELLGKGKHLQLAVNFTLASLQTEGLGGFHQGLSLIQGLLVDYWERLHPLPHPDDEGDMSERLGILAAMNVPLGADKDPWKFQERLRNTPLFRNRSAAYSLRDIRLAEESNAADGALQKIENALMMVDGADVMATLKLLTDSVGVIRGIDSNLRARVGEDAESWRVLLETMNELHSKFAKIAATVGKLQNSLPVQIPEATTMEPSPEYLTNKSGEVRPGGAEVIVTIRSRDDVVRVLNLICDYYKTSEPSSPIPLLLRRAQKLVNKDFLQIIEELNVGSSDNLRTLIGKDQEG